MLRFYKYLLTCVGVVVLFFAVVVNFAQSQTPADVTGRYLPYIQVPSPTPTLTPTPAPSPLPPPIPLSGQPPIDFDDVREQLNSQGQALAFVKVGFHTGIGGNANGLGTWMRDLDAAGVPLFLKSVDNAGPLYEVQEIMKESGVPHTLVYRRSGLGFDLPNYDLPPKEAARVHWERHRDHFPPELDPSLVWIETVNEVDKNRSEWLAEFAIETAHLAMADGFRWAAFGWSAGEPEPEHWESPKMLEFLRLVGEHPDQLAIALHEYSYTDDQIGNGYPYLVGRFQHLFAICDAHNIPRPTILITEWGWEYQDVPDVGDALEDIRWASLLYAAYPQMKGAAIWYLGGGFGGIANQAQKLIMPMRDYSLSHYFSITPGQGSIDTDIFQTGTDPLPDATPVPIPPRKVWPTPPPASK